MASKRKEEKRCCNHDRRFLFLCISRTQQRQWHREKVKKCTRQETERTNINNMQLIKTETVEDLQRALNNSNATVFYKSLYYFVKSLFICWTSLFFCSIYRQNQVIGSVSLQKLCDSKTEKDEMKRKMSIDKITLFMKTEGRKTCCTIQMPSNEWICAHVKRCVRSGKQETMCGEWALNSPEFIFEHGEMSD